MPIAALLALGLLYAVHKIMYVPSNELTNAYKKTNPKGCYFSPREFIFGCLNNNRSI